MPTVFRASAWKGATIDDSRLKVSSVAYVCEQNSLRLTEIPMKSMLVPFLDHVNMPISTGLEFILGDIRS